MVRGARGLLAIAVTAALVLMGACGSDEEPPLDPNAKPVVTADYLPGLAADLHLPTGAATAPVVVLVPGGAWVSADPSGLTPLARALAAGGIVAVTMT
ncbi:MAG: hypothetical protein WAL50_02540, partial [Kineosporiaceae bacterium]